MRRLFQHENQTKRTVLVSLFAVRMDCIYLGGVTSGDMRRVLFPSLPEACVVQSRRVLYI